MQFGQIYIRINFIASSGKRLTSIQTNTFCNLDKYVLQFGQIHFAIWTNRYFILDKYIMPFGQIHFVVSAVQSVGNLRRSLLARTRVCQMFPFTSYNPLGHRQSTNLNCHVNTFFTELGKCFIFLKPHAEMRKNS